MSQMYPWVTENCRTWNPLAGTCPHNCSYCYVNYLKEKFPVLKQKYSGPPRLVEKELKTRFKAGETVFVCSMTDLFADNVPDGYISRIIEHTRKFPDTTFLFQTKNPERLYEWLFILPKKSIIGTTIETDDLHLSKKISKAPDVYKRADWMSKIRLKLVFNRDELKDIKTMVSIEPVIKFDPAALFYLVVELASPDFISIGADSKGNNLPEPKKGDIIELINGIKRVGIEVRIKDNLNRILHDESPPHPEDRKPSGQTPPSTPTGEASASPSVFGSSGDTYEYYPRRVEYD